MFRVGEVCIFVCCPQDCGADWADLQKFNGRYVNVVERNITPVCPTPVPGTWYRVNCLGTLFQVHERLLIKLPKEPTGSWSEVFTIIGWEPSKIFSRPTEK